MSTTAGLTTNTVQGKAYGAKLSNASRLVRVMNTEIPKSTSSTSRSSVSSIKNVVAQSQFPNMSGFSNSIPKKELPPTSSVHVSNPITVVQSRVSSFMPKSISSIIKSPTTSSVHTSYSPTVSAVQSRINPFANRFMMR